MTECERIIANGILPRSFFEEEVRNGFRVTTKRKKIWAVELDLLLKFEEVCKKYNLKWCLAGGSMLGAVRHQGFIPWDDDMDIIMFRNDYETLLQHVDEFENPYFLQTPSTDPQGFYSYARLRNSNTTGFSDMFAYQPMNHGIWIDIFPLDFWQKKDAESDGKIKKLNLENSTYLRMKNPYLNEANKERIRNWSGKNPIDVYKEINGIAMQYSEDESDCLLLAVCSIIAYSKRIRYKADYEEVILADFEGFQFPIPKGFKNVLSNQYGDYLKFPPVEERGIWHFDAVFEPDIPYLEFLKSYHAKELPV